MTTYFALLVFRPFCIFEELKTEPTMNSAIPQNWNDEVMEYANRLADRINVGWDGEGPCPSDWSLLFLSRLNKGLVKAPFTYEAFMDNDDIMATLEGYGLDAEKFWYALLFIYDITTSFCLNAADARKTDYEVLTELNDFLQQHPKAVLYLSEDRELRKSVRYETNSPLILDCLRRFVQQELAQYPVPPRQKILTIDPRYRNYTESLSTAQQQVLIYRLFKELFDLLQLPELRAKRGEVVSYSKLLLVSRIIYFCRLTVNESFTVDSSSLKGVLKQYGKTDFNQLEPRVYTGGLILSQEEGE